LRAWSPEPIHAVQPLPKGTACTAPERETVTFSDEDDTATVHTQSWSDPDLVALPVVGVVGLKSGPDGLGHEMVTNALQRGDTGQRGDPAPSRVSPA
jgi:hypothetical protein